MVIKSTRPSQMDMAISSRRPEPRGSGYSAIGVLRRRRQRSGSGTGGNLPVPGGIRGCPVGGGPQILGVECLIKESAIKTDLFPRKVNFGVCGRLLPLALVVQPPSV